ncbi:chemotaxis protein MotA [Aurantiacibacter xanthus]|uniref:Chemotaxis protein MotA n=1 Tax=Aurantiacibacter xanthus TaxID=1784712 RepID=A0A3A1P464_9SPHN|nr:MotA/TolQ/ExbB proton channel family protein [Aurantiacibacter xanthus]RIV81353.1 chemotaxis protein MotA [Aurantiacibacter xanthus]
MPDPTSIAIVVGLTLLATLLQSGLRDSRTCLVQCAALLKKPFDPVQTRAELAREIGDLRKDGLVRARPTASGDPEFDRSTNAMVRARSVEALMAEHEACRTRRFAQAATAQKVCHHAADLAQMMGLAGTLISLATLAPSAAAGPSLTGAVGMAVGTTLTGVALGNFVFIPLAGLIERRSRSDDDAREEVFTWLEMHAHIAVPRLRDEEPLTVLHKGVA